MITIGQGAWLRALLAHRSEQESGEAAVTARADDQQVGTHGGLDEDRCGRPLNGRALEFDPGVGTGHLRDGSVEESVGPGLERADVDPHRRCEPGRGYVRIRPGIDDPQPRAAEPSFLKRPAQRFHRFRGAVDADNDLAHVA
jgi:hypothetical protein